MSGRKQQDVPSNTQKANLSTAAWALGQIETLAQIGKENAMWGDVPETMKAIEEIHTHMKLIKTRMAKQFVDDGYTYKQIMTMMGIDNPGSLSNILNKEIK